MIDSLRQAWDTGRLIRPDAGLANTVDLVQALAGLAGALIDLSPSAIALSRRIGQCDHLVFILVDGLGVDRVKTLPADAFLRAHLVSEIRSVYPSTTAAAITTIATGRWPAEHGVVGWWTYLPDRGMTATSLPFFDRMSGKLLTELGFDHTLLWSLPTLLEGVRRDARSVHPATFFDSVFNRYARGTTRGSGYTSIESGIDQVIGRVATATRLTYTYLYIPELDTACHVNGKDGAATTALLGEIDAQLRRLAGALAGKARLVISADHGHAAIPAGQHLELRDGDPLLDTLHAPPACEPRAPCFHVRPGRHEEFRRRFVGTYGDRFALLTIDEVDELRLLGLGPMSAITRQRLGDYLAVALEAFTLVYYAREGPAARKLEHKSHHGGMTREEMCVPLILA